MKAVTDYLQVPLIQTSLSLFGLVVVAWLCGVLTRLVLFRIVRRLARRTAWKWDDAMFQLGVFRWLGRLVPVLVIQLGVPLLHNVPKGTATLVEHITLALMVFCLVMAINAALNAMEMLYRQSPMGNNRPIKGVIQLIKIGIFIIATLSVIASVTDKSVGLLLSGLGAMSAVLMLVFKDTILGFVAGMQLAANDMLRVGDWITMPGSGADGTVIDISLYTVKVSNFDHTVVTIPTWRLISESYQNWRGMSDSGGRRIMRALVIDAASVHFLDADELAQLSRFRLLDEYLTDKNSELDAWNKQLGEAGEQQVNRRRLTNLGTFRAYVGEYLRQHPKIHRQMTCMVRQLATDAQGIPLQLYCFTATTAWIEYEGIQADIFDHLFALLPEFGLRLYQQPAGSDMRIALATRMQQASPPAAIGDEA